MSDQPLHTEDLRSDLELPEPQISAPESDFARLELSQEQALILLSSSATLGDLFNHRVEARVNERTALFREIIQEQNVQISKLRPSDTTSADSSSISWTTTPPEPCQPSSSSTGVDNARPDFSDDQARKLIKDSVTLKRLFSSNVKFRVDKRTAKLRQAVAAKDVEVANLQQKLEIAAWEARIKHAELVELREKLEHSMPSAPAEREDMDSSSARERTNVAVIDEVSLESLVLDKIRGNKCLQSSIQAVAQVKAMELWAIDEHDTKLAEWTTAMIVNGKNSAGISAELNEVLHISEPNDPSILEFTRCLFEKADELTRPEQPPPTIPSVVVGNEGRPFERRKSPWPQTIEDHEKFVASPHLSTVKPISAHEQSPHPPLPVVDQEVLEQRKKQPGSSTKRRRDDSYMATFEPDTEHESDDDETQLHRMSKRRKIADTDGKEDNDEENEERKDLEEEGDWRWWEW